MTTHQQEALWIGALAVVPVAVMVATMCRAAGRPATRHALWLLALLTFVVPGVLVVTGLSSVVAGAVLGVPRALAWAFPPERAGVEVDAARAEGAERERSVAAEPGAAPGAVRSANVVPESVEPAVEAPARIAGADRARVDGGRREIERLQARPRDHAPIPVRRSGPDLARSVAAGVPRSVTASDTQSVRVAGAPSISDGGRTARPAIDSGAADAVAGSEPRPAADANMPGWAAWLLAEGLGLRAPDREPEGTERARREAAGAGREASPAGLIADRRLASTDVALGAASRPSASEDSGGSSGPRAHAGGSDGPAIVDPIWNAMSSASVAFQAWGASIGRAAASVADIPAPPAALWIGGVLVIIALGGMRTLAGNAAIRRVQPVDRSDRRLVEDLSERLGLRDAPRAYLVKRRISPMVCGGLNPRIILPEALWKTLDLDARRAVLTHELAHLRRRDQWIRLFELMVGIAYWWHPVLWAVRRRIREEADLCCDAWVTTLFPGLRRSYAEALVRTRAYLSMPGAVAPVGGLGMASARSRKFSRRLTMVMTGQTRPRTSPLGVALALAVGAATLVVVPSIAHATLGKKGPACPPEQTVVAGTAAPTPSARAAEAYGLVSRAAGTPRASVAPRAALNYYGVDAAHNGVAPADVFYGVTAAAPAGGQPAGSCCSAPASDAITPAASDPVVSSVPVLVNRFRQSATAAATAQAYTDLVHNGLAVQGAYAASGDGLEDRVRALESRIEALDASIQRLLMHLEGGADAGIADPFGRPVAVPTPTITAYGSFLNAAQFQVAQEAQQDGEASWQAYSVPEGKLEALWALMSRSDVPIYVSMGDGQISLEGTPRQQRVFAQFLALIHPEGAGEWVADPFEDGAWADEARAAEEAYAAAQGRRGDVEAERDARAMLERELSAERARQGDARSHELMARQDALRAHRAALEAELVARTEQGRHMAEHRRATGRQHAEMMSRQAEQMERRAEQVEARLEQLRDRANSARDDSQREAFEVQIEGLEAEAEALREAADEIRSQSDDVSAELEEAMAEMEADLADARDELEEAMRELEDELANASEGEGERAINCACTGECTGEGCEDDCSENCHCRTGTAEPAPAAREARPARPARPARAATPRPTRD